MLSLHNAGNRRARQSLQPMTRRGFLALGVSLTLAGASRARAQAPKSLHLVFTPSQRPTDLLAAGEEFGGLLGKLIGVPIRVTVTSDYAAVVEALRNRTADLAFMHPAGYVLANRDAGAMIIVKNVLRGKTTFTARLYVRKDSGLESLEQLRGKTLAFVDPSSTSGYVYPMVMLMQRGLVKNRDPKTFFRDVVYAGSHDAALLALLNRRVDAAASYDQAPESYLKNPADRASLSWVAETEPVPEGGVAGRAGLDPALVARVRAALLQMRGGQYTPLLKRMYDIDGFEPADDREYAPVRAAFDLLGWRPKS
jgi:phosphonate transport system substrate-binding protein